MFERTLLDNLVMQPKPSRLCLLEDLDIPVHRIRCRHRDRHDQVVVSESPRPWGNACQVAETILRIDIEDEYALRIQVAFRCLERTDPVGEAQHVVHRVVWTNHGIEGAGQPESGHVLSVKPDLRKLFSRISKHGWRNVESGDFIVPYKRRQMRTGSTGDFQDGSRTRMVPSQEVEVRCAAGYALGRIVKVPVDRVRLHRFSLQLAGVAAIRQKESEGEHAFVRTGLIAKLIAFSAP